MKTIHSKGKRLILLIAIAMGSLGLCAQVDTAAVYMRGSDITIMGGTTLFIDGNLHNITSTIVGDPNPFGQINNLDTMYLSGNLRYISPLAMFASSNFGVVTMNKSFVQSINGNDIQFYHLILNKTLNDIWVSRNVTVTGNLGFVKGNFNMLDNYLDLSTSGVISGENSSRRVVGNYGYILARQRSIATQRIVDSLGFTLSNVSGCGLTDVYRYFRQQQYVTDGSIRRYFDFKPSSAGSFDIDYKYLDHEWSTIAGDPQKRNLRLFRTTKTGLDQAYKYRKLSSVSFFNQNYIRASGVSVDGGGIRLTVADTICNNPPYAPFQTTPILLCAGGGTSAVTLNAANPGCEYLWSHNGATSQTVVINTSSFAMGETVDTFYVTVTDTLGCSATTGQIVSVKPQPVANFTNPASFCAGADATYSNTSSISNGEPLTYLWTFHDGASTSLTNPKKNYSSHGLFNVTLTATSLTGCAASVTKQTTVSPIPVAAFSPDKTSTCINSPITLTNQSTIAVGGFARSEWTFGDGYTSTLYSGDALNPEIKAYSNAGTYQIKLNVVSSGNCSASVTHQVTSNHNPVADFNTSGFLLGTTTSFQNTSTIADGTPLQYSWSFGDGSPVNTNIHPTNNYAALGDYSVNLSASSINNCSSSSTKSIHISALPVANFSYSSPHYCEGLAVQFTNTSTITGADSLSMLWEFGDASTSTLLNPLKSYSQAGIYTVKLTVTSRGGTSASTNQTITINPLPVASFNAASVCKGSNVSFNNSSTLSQGSMSYSWNFGDTSFSTTQNPQKLYSYWGAFTSKLVVTSDKGCGDSIIRVVEVYPVPTAAFTANNICQGLEQVFLNQSTIASGSLSYTWNFNDGTYAYEAEPGKGFAAPGIYPVSLTPVSNNGCSHTVVHNVQIFEKPVAAFTSTKVCNGAAVEFTNNSILNNGTIGSVWDFGEGSTSVELNPKKVFSNANQYSVTLIVNSNNACSDTAIGVAEVYPVPVPDFTSDNSCEGVSFAFHNATTIAAPAPKAVLTWLWKYGDGRTSINKEGSHTYLSSGNYNVSLTATSVYGCKASVTKVVRSHQSPVASFAVFDTCATLPLRFENQSVSTDGNMTYEWNFSDNTTQTTSVPNKSFSLFGTYNIGLKATSQYGCTQLINKSVSIFDNPVATFTSPDSICLSSIAPISNNSYFPEGFNTFLWSFGNGKTNNKEQPDLLKYASPGLYNISLMVSSENGCKSLFSKQIKINAEPVADFNNLSNAPNEPVTFDNLSVYTGSSSISYNWNFGDGSRDTTGGDALHLFENPGFYNVSLQARAANTCQSTIQKIVTITDAPEASFAVEGNQCFGNSIRFINTSKVSSFETASYYWDFGDGSTSITENPEKNYALTGSYTVKLKVSYLSGKSSQYSKTVNVYSYPIANFNQLTACANTAILFTDVSTGFINASFSWSFGDGSTASIRNPSKTYTSPGVYDVNMIITTEYGCADTITQQISVHALPNLDLGDSIVTCGLSYLLDPGISASTYQWMPGNITTSTLNATMNGTYKLSLTDLNQCTAVDSVVVTLNTPMQVNLGADRAICTGDSVDAGFLGATFLWSDGSSKRYLKPIISGQYSVTVTDINACSDKDTIQLTVNALPVVNLGNDTAFCDGRSMVLNSQHANDLKKWSTGDTSTLLSVTRSGKYLLQLIDSKGCKAYDQINIDVKLVPVVDLGSDIIICSDETPVVLDAGEGMQSYLWSVGESGSKLSVNQTGNYNVLVSASNGCSASDSIAVTVNPAPVSPLWADTTNVCEFDTLVLRTQNPGYNYYWSDGSSDSLKRIPSAGKYGVQISSVSGCKINAFTTVVYHSLPRFNLNSEYDVCSYNKPAVISIPNEFHNYQWNGLSLGRSLSTDTSGRYIAKALDPYGCSFTDTLQVNIITPPALRLPDTIATCQKTLIELDSKIAGINYLWSTGATTQSIKASRGGEYRLRATDSYGCISYDTTWLQEYLLPSIYMGENQTLCQGETTTLTGGNDTTLRYKWSTGDTINKITVSTAGVYLVTVTDQRNCSNIDTVKINYVSAPKQTLPETMQACDNLLLDAGNDGATYLWNNNSTVQQLPVTKSGKYSVLVTIGNCKVSQATNVTIFPLPKFNLGKDTAICTGTSLTLDALIPNAQYVWSTDSTKRAIVVSKAGKYIAKVTDRNNCAFSDTISLGLRSLPTFDLGASRDICIGDSVQIGTNLLGMNYSWSNGASQAQIFAKKTNDYRLKVTDAYKCTFTDTVKVTVRPYPVVNLGRDTILCRSYTLNAGNDKSTYLWKTGYTGQELRIDSSDLYWVRVTSEYNCSATDTVSVVIKPAPTLVILGSRDICQGDTSHLKVVSSNKQFTWSSGDTTEIVDVFSLRKLWAYTSDENGCGASDTAEVVVRPLPVVDFGQKKVLCGQTYVTLDAGNIGSSYEWTGDNKFKATERVVQIYKDGHYNVKIINKYGCTTIDSIFIDRSKELLNARFIFPSNVDEGDSLWFQNFSYPSPYLSLWDFGDGVLDTVNSPYHKYFVSGKLFVKLRVSNGLCSDTLQKSIVVNQLQLPPGQKSNRILPENKFISDAKAYPNPVRDFVTLEIELTHPAKMGVDIVGMDGIRVKNDYFTATELSHRQYNLSRLPNGMYIIRITVYDEVKIIKILKL